MNYIELLFALISKFVPISPVRIEQLRASAQIWYDRNIKKVGVDPSAPAEPQNKFVETLAKYGEEWYVQSGLAVLFIFLVRFVHDFMNPSADGDDDDDDQYPV